MVIGPFSTCVEPSAPPRICLVHRQYVARRSGDTTSAHAADRVSGQEAGPGVGSPGLGCWAGRRWNCVMSEALAILQDRSFARAAAATASSCPPGRRLTGQQLAAYLDRRAFAVTGSSRPDGRPHAAMSSSIRRGTAMWLPTVAGSVRERNVRRQPWLTMTVTGGDRDLHRRPHRRTSRPRPSRRGPSRRPRRRHRRLDRQLDPDTGPAAALLCLPGSPAIGNTARDSGHKPAAYQTVLRPN